MMTTNSKMFAMDQALQRKQGEPSAESMSMDPLSDVVGIFINTQQQNRNWKLENWNVLSNQRAPQKDCRLDPGSLHCSQRIVLPYSTRKKNKELSLLCRYSKYDRSLS